MTSHPSHDPTRHSSPAVAQDKLEELLTNHLTVSLEPQRGRALAAFRAKVAEEEAPAPIPISRGRENVVPKRALWYWAGVPSLVAAGLAVVVTLQVAKQPPTTPIGPSDPKPIQIATEGGGTETIPSPGTTIAPPCARQ
jgi:hypothetical protein